MRHYLIASHGTLAQGFYDALNAIIGSKPEISIITAYVDNSEIKKLIEKKICLIGADDELIIMTDIFGGSVNNLCMEYLNRPNIHLIAGVNLALIISIVISHDEDTKSMIENCIEEAKKNVIYCNDLTEPKGYDDF